MMNFKHKTGYAIQKITKKIVSSYLLTDNMADLAIYFFF